MGGETLLLANSHITLRREGKGNFYKLLKQVTNNYKEKPDLAFNKMFRFGPSTKNQRIESFWNLLANGLTDTYRNIFASYQRDGLFTKGNTIDKIALKFVYMPMVRKHVYAFVDMHNTHKIRRQRKRAHYLPTGIPDEMFNYPQSKKDYGREPNWETHTKLQAEVLEYDLDVFLPERTMFVCRLLLEEEGFEIDFPDLRANHKEAYLYLREALYDYSENEELTLLEKPTDPEEWLRSHAPSNDVYAYIDSEFKRPDRKDEALISTDNEDSEEHEEVLSNF